MAQLESLDSHFAFGANWRSYSALISEPQIEAATQSMLRLMQADQLRGRSFADIGCGSGLHSLIAANLGVSGIYATDIDPESVATTREVLRSNNVTVPWEADTVSVFDLPPRTFDIVYSWGVLHHTGDMWSAIESAARLVADGGLFVIAIYRTTYLDSLWKIEKLIYSHSPRSVQSLISAVYIAAFRIAMFAMGRSFSDYISNYKSSRGMNFQHDIHDWLGGYPYETARAKDIDDKLRSLEFKAEKVFTKTSGLGLFGSGCDEYVYRRY